MDKLFVEIQFDITKFSVIGFVLTGLFVVNESACLPYFDLGMSLGQKFSARA